MLRMALAVVICAAAAWLLAGAQVTPVAALGAIAAALLASGVGLLIGAGGAPLAVWASPFSRLREGLRVASEALAVRPKGRPALIRRRETPRRGVGFVIVDADGESVLLHVLSETQFENPQ